MTLTPSTVVVGSVLVKACRKGRRTLRARARGRVGRIADTRRLLVTVVPVERRVRMSTGTVITVDYARQVVEKSHPDAGKLRDEVDWYRLLPDDLRDLAPVVSGDGLGPHGYEMTLVPGPGMDELWVFGGHPREFWETAFGSLGSVLDRLHAYERQDAYDPSAAQRDMYVIKTLERIALLRPAAGVTLPPSLWTGPRLDGKPLPGLERVEETLAETYRRSRLAVPRPQTIVHGDFHLGNLFYAPSTAKITVIDPRGSFAGRRGVHGDPAYDDLKLGHSIVGDYDRVSLGSLRATGTEEGFVMGSPPPAGAASARLGAEWLVDRVRREYGMAERDLLLGVSVLLLSLAVLHADPERQTSHLLRGLQIYGEVL